MTDHLCPKCGAEIEGIGPSQSEADFIAMASHELKTPLTSIIASAEILEYEMFGSINEDQREVLARIQRDSQHLLGMITHILDFARHEEEHASLSLEQIDIEQIVGRVVETVNPLLEGTGLELDVSIDDRLRPCYADSEKLYRIFLNLVENAIKFSDRGKIRVRVKLAANEVEGLVADEGIGIRAGDLEEIFGAFHQADSSSTRRYPGVGLGLAITKQLVELHGGHIRAESHPAGGSQFVFGVPYVTTPPAKAWP